VLMTKGGLDDLGTAPRRSRTAGLRQRNPLRRTLPGIGGTGARPTELVALAIDWWKRSDRCL